MACSGCPIVTACLRWALVNKPVTRFGIWAATTPGQRNGLRKRLADRLGPDWIDVLAHQDQLRREPLSQAPCAEHRLKRLRATHTVARAVLDTAVGPWFLSRYHNGPVLAPLRPGTGGSDAGSGDRFGYAAWRAGVVMTVSNSTGVSRPSDVCRRRRW